MTEKSKSIQEALAEVQRNAEQKKAERIMNEWENMNEMVGGAVGRAAGQRVAQLGLRQSAQNIFSKLGSTITGQTAKAAPSAAPAAASAAAPAASPAAPAQGPHRRDARLHRWPRAIRGDRRGGRTDPTQTKLESNALIYIQKYMCYCHGVYL